MILPRVREPRLVTVRRGGSLSDEDHRALALWAAWCAERVLALFEEPYADDPRPRDALEHVRGWVRGEVLMMRSRAAGGHAMGAARDKAGASRFAAYAAGQAACVPHVAEHDLGAAAYALKAVRAAAERDGRSGTDALRDERRAQHEALPTRCAHWCWRTRSVATRSVGACSAPDGPFSRFRRCSDNGHYVRFDVSAGLVLPRALAARHGARPPFSPPGCAQRRPSLTIRACTSSAQPP